MRGNKHLGMHLAKLQAPDTPEFKAWFSGSKVVDLQGGPLVVYHGTKSEITGGFFPFSHFGTSSAANDALIAGNDFWDWTEEGYGDSDARPRIFPCYLRILNPIPLKDQEGWGNYEQFGIWLKELRHKGFLDSEVFNDLYGEWTESNSDDFVDSGLQVLLVEALQKRGYDGIKYTNAVEDIGSESWVIFSPDQVWNALSNKVMASRNVYSREYQEPLTFINDTTNYQHGQMDGRLSAFRAEVPKELLGYILWTFYQDELSIRMIWVRDEFRRRGLGTALIKRLREEFPKEKYEPGVRTTEGTYFFKSTPVQETLRKIAELVRKAKISSGGAQLRETKVPVPSGVFSSLGIPVGNVFADYLALFRKHPEYFSSPEDVQRHVEFVLVSPEEILPAAELDHRLLIRTEETTHRAVVVEIELRGGKYRIKTAFIMGSKQLEVKRKRAGWLGGRILVPGKPSPRGTIARSAPPPLSGVQASPVSKSIGPPREKNKTLASQHTAGRMRFFHGTSSTFWPGIQSQGLIPNPKKRVWEQGKSSPTSKGREPGSHSLESYPGAYVTSSYSKANGAAGNAVRNFGGDLLILTGEMETRSPDARVDEDHFTSPSGYLQQEGLIFNPREFPTQALPFLTGEPYYDVDGAAAKWALDLKIPEQALSTVLPLAKRLIISETILNGILGMESSYASFLEKGYWWSGNTKQVYDAAQAKFGGELPSDWVRLAEKTYRSDVNALLAKVTKYLEKKEQGGYSPSFRFEESPIGFSGSNHIDGVVSIPYQIEHVAKVDVLYRKGNTGINQILEGFETSGGYPYVLMENGKVRNWWVGPGDVSDIRMGEAGESWGRAQEIVQAFAQYGVDILQELGSKKQEKVAGRTSIGSFYGTQGGSNLDTGKVNALFEKIFKLNYRVLSQGEDEQETYELAWSILFQDGKYKVLGPNRGEHAEVEFPGTDTDAIVGLLHTHPGGQEAELTEADEEIAQEVANRTGLPLLMGVIGTDPYDEEGGLTLVVDEFSPEVTRTGKKAVGQHYHAKLTPILYRGQEDWGQDEFKAQTTPGVAARFTEDPSYAKSYGDVKTFRLRVNRPLSVFKYQGLTLEGWRRVLEQKGLKGIVFDSELEEGQPYDFWEILDPVGGDAQFDSNLIDLAKQAGYDAIIYEEGGTFLHPARTWAVFSNDQIIPLQKVGDSKVLGSRSHKGKGGRIIGRFYGSRSMKLSRRVGDYLQGEDGKPLFLYHGTSYAGFTSFKPGYDGFVYLTPSPEYAEAYTSGGMSAIPKTEEPPKDQQGIYKVLLKDPVIFDTTQPEHRKIFQDEYLGKHSMSTAPLDSALGLPDWTEAGNLREFFEEMGYPFDTIMLADAHGYLAYVVGDPSKIVPWYRAHTMES